MFNHNCAEHLVHREGDFVETHGLNCGPYEHFHEEWEECSVCHEKYTPEEAQQMATQEDMEAEMRPYTEVEF